MPKACDVLGATREQHRTLCLDCRADITTGRFATLDEVRAHRCEKGARRKKNT